LKNYPELKKVLHCFSGKKNLVKEATSLGCYFSIPTNIVRSEQFQEMLKIIPRQKILTETDAPYLSPFPEKQNEPAFIDESIKIISKLWNISTKETEKIIEDNFKKVFKE
jgi:TatD DNase family protein